MTAYTSNKLPKHLCKKVDILVSFPTCRILTLWGASIFDEKHVRQCHPFSYMDLKLWQISSYMFSVTDILTLTKQIKTSSHTDNKKRTCDL